MADYNAFAATQIRTIGAIISFAILFIFMKQYRSFFASLRNKRAMKTAALGSFFGPFLGVSLSLYAVQRINPGVASTMMSITPVILLGYAAIIKKRENCTKRDSRFICCGRRTSIDVHIE